MLLNIHRPEMFFSFIVKRGHFGEGIIYIYSSNSWKQFFLLHK